MNKSPRYRPAFNATEIKTALKIFKTAYASNITNPLLTDQEENTCLVLIRKLNTLDAKIASNSITPEYLGTSSTERKEAVMESLGTETYPNPGYRRKAAYTKYTRDLALCSKAEINDAMEHKYLNELMSPVEAEAYEKRMQKDFVDIGDL